MYPDAQHKFFERGASMLFRRSLLLSLVMAGQLFSVTAHSQSTLYALEQYITEAKVQEFHQALQSLMKAEQKQLSLNDARHIVTTGTLSALSRICGLAWDQKVFLPMMAYFRHSRKLSEQQMTYIGVLHGFQQGQVINQVPEGSCTADTRAFISKLIQAQPEL
jgi:hypothetical protein